MAPAASRSSTASFIDRTTESFVRSMERALFAEEIARANGLLQRIDPRTKILALFGLIVAAAMARNLSIVFALFAVALILAASSRVYFLLLIKRVWLPVLFFTGAIAIFAPFITPGLVLLRIPLLGGVTLQGLRSAAYLIARAETAATFCVLLILCTPWSHVLKALRVLRVPSILVVILATTYRYIFLLLHTASDMFVSHRSRLIGSLSGPDRRRLAAASAGVLLSRSFSISSDVYSAMQSRGFRGEAYTLDDFSFGAFDVLVLMIAVAVVFAAVWLGR